MPTGSKSSKKQAKATRRSSSWLRRYVDAQKKRHASFMARRPHRSFRLTRRRDYVRPLELPGNIAFTYEVTSTLWKYRKMFSLLILVYVLLYAVLVGIQSQETYSVLTNTLKETGSDLFSGNWGAIGQAGLLLASIASTGVSAEMTESQQIFSVFIFLLAWLTSVWLLRNLLAGHKVKLRDGLYSSGAPIFAMLIVVIFIAIQLIPAALALIGYSAAATTGLLEGRAVSMLFWIGAALLIVLSLYWITSSLFAMIIVTLPGMYPYRAIRAASDMMLGRRIKILLRWLWMALIIVLVWALVMIPIILLDMALKSVWPAIEWLPIVPIATLIMAGATTIWMSTYVYLLYRKVVDYVPVN